MYSARDNTALPVLGFPIRESAGQRLFSTSPRLIAAVHALLRLLMPRHPPCALTILTVIVDRTGGHRSEERFAPGYNGDLLNAARKQACAAAIPLFGQLCSFQGPARAQPGGLPGWSLKTQQCTTRSLARVAAAKTSCDGPPGPVDIQGRRVVMRPARRARPMTSSLERR